VLCTFVDELGKCAKCTAEDQACYWAGQTRQGLKRKSAAVEDAGEGSSKKAKIGGGAPASKAQSVVEVSAPFVDIVRTPEKRAIVESVDKGKAKVETVPLYEADDGEPPMTTRLAAVSAELDLLNARMMTFLKVKRVLEREKRKLEDALENGQ
jgi:hypothetical protein